MVRYEIHSETPHLRMIHKAADILKEGGIVIYPTDTVYGIGCSMYHKPAIEKLYKIKGKSKFQSMSMICDSIQQASQYVHISNATFRILKKCFPGPYTIILPAKHEIAKLMLSRQKEIGVRIPGNPVCQLLVRELTHPILNTSVSMPEDDLGFYPEPESRNLFTDSADLMLDIGPFPDQVESTVLRIHDNEIEILREGKGDIGILSL